MDIIPDILKILLGWGLLVGFADIIDDVDIIAHNSSKNIYIEREVTKSTTPKANINNKPDLLKSTAKGLDKIEQTGLKIQ